ncbi:MULTISPECIES: glycosyltransferase [Clostridium]|uniref:glycosyltransferase n=1 Tax=Clostridium TaxID=1485 RepID=UPI0018AA483F|nr:MULTISPECIES: glycosyltransferase [Clostridium]MBX9185755.1 glycosyltransferase [Clostridium sp. K04]
MNIVVRPHISIIVPIYKVEKYLERCINSILNQNFSNFELILVDDGSPDDCGKICDEYKRIDNRIKVIHKKNEGLSAARNSGIEVAIGDYIAFVDADDFINRDMYRVLYENAIKSQADISICNFEYIYEQSQVNENSIVLVKPIESYDKNESLKKLYSNEKIQFIVAWNKIYKRELFLDIRYDYGKCHEDEFIIHKLLFKANRVVYTSTKLYYYLQRNESIMKSSFSVNRVDILEALENRMEFFRSEKMMDLEYKTQNSYLNYFFNYYYKIKYKLKNNDKSKEMKKQFRNNYKYLLINPNYSIKGKLLWYIFLINSYLFYFVLELNDNNEMDIIKNS